MTPRGHHTDKQGCMSQQSQLGRLMRRSCSRVQPFPSSLCAGHLDTALQGLSGTLSPPIQRTEGYTIPPRLLGL